jgi:hypothetical protein
METSVSTSVKLEAVQVPRVIRCEEFMVAFRAYLIFRLHGIQ